MSQQLTETDCCDVDACFVGEKNRSTMSVMRRWAGYRISYCQHYKVQNTGHRAFQCVRVQLRQWKPFGCRLSVSNETSDKRCKQLYTNIRACVRTCMHTDENCNFYFFKCWRILQKIFQLFAPLCSSFPKKSSPDNNLHFSLDKLFSV